MAHIIVFLPQWHSRGYTQDKFILMYAMLFIHRNTGVRRDEQNLAAAAVSVHVLENLLAADTAHGKKLVGLILSFPESQRREAAPHPRAGSADLRALGVLRVLVQLGAAQSTPAQPSHHPA